MTIIQSGLKVSVGLTWFAIAITTKASAQDIIVQAQDQLISPSVPVSYEGFGSSVSQSENKFIVGFPEFRLINNTGGARIFTYDQLTDLWVKTQLIAPVDHEDYENAEFGHAVSLLGNTAVIGAPHKNNWDGAVFVSTANVQGVWSTPAELPRVDALTGERFGFSVSQTQDRIAIGAPFHGTPLDKNGVVYIYKLENGGWAQEQVLNAPEYISTDDQFGFSVCLFEDWLVVGSPYGGTHGKVSMFTHDGTEWVLVATYFSPPHEITNTESTMGYAVSMSRTNDDLLWVFAGDPTRDDQFCADENVEGGMGDEKIEIQNGIVRVLRFANDEFLTNQILTARDCIVGALFGYAVDASENRAAIGSPFADP